MGEDQMRLIIDTVYHLDEIEDIRELMRLLVCEIVHPGY